MKGKPGPRPGPKKPRGEKKAKPEKEETNGTEAPKQQAAPGPGHNGPAPLMDDQQFALLNVHKKAYAKALDAKKKADADLKNVCKLAKSELGADAVDSIKDIIALETPEGEAAFKARIERQARVARWLGLPLGTQGSIFETVDRTPAVEKAAARGKRDGLAGDPCRPECDPSTPQYKAYMDGFHEGQAVLAQGIKPTVPEKEGGEELDALDDASETALAEHHEGLDAEAEPQANTTH